MGVRGATAPWKISPGKTHQNRARSGNHLHKNMTKMPTHDTLQQVVFVQKQEKVANFDNRLNCEFIPYYRRSGQKADF